MTPERTDRLVVWLDDEPVADLAENKNRTVQLQYRPAVLDRYDRNTPLLSCALPVQPRPLDATAFFDGVLPEPPHRADLAARADVAAGDTFGLLARYGRDIAGALVILSQGETPTTHAGSVIELSLSDLEAEVQALPERSLGIHDDSELSLAGVQDKMLLVGRADGSWGRPIGGTPSTHMLKLDHRVHAGVVEAEAQALALARAAGLTTIESQLETISGVRCLIVSRFDRTVTEDGTVVRIHQEDMCQALGLLPQRKYELRQGGGGPEFEQIASLLDLHADDVPAQLNRLASIAAFTAMIGNADAHGKNLALLHTGPGRVQLAPLYDTVPTVLWPALVTDAAMSIGGTVSLSAVDSNAIAREARRWHHSPDEAVAAARATAVAVLDALDGGEVVDPGEPLAEVVRERAAHFLD